VVVVTVQSIFCLEMHQNKNKNKNIFDINISKYLHRVSKHTLNPTIKIRKKNMYETFVPRNIFLCSLLIKREE
jgi:hypothetical protein